MSSPMVAIHRRGEGDIWQGLWEPFNASLHDDKSASPEEIEQMLHLPHPSTLRLLAKDVKHVLSHRILLADFYLLEVSLRPQLPEGYIWIHEHDIEQYGVPRLIEILLEKALRV